jgi:hypothetical protein
MVVILLLVPSSTSASLTTTTYTTSVSSTPAKCLITSTTNSSALPHRLPTNYQYGPRPYPFTHQSKFTTSPDANRNYSREYVNHVTRINISNDYPQIDGASGEPEAVVKEGKKRFVYVNNRLSIMSIEHKLCNHKITISGSSQTMNLSINFLCRIKWLTTSHTMLSTLKAKPTRLDYL